MANMILQFLNASNNHYLEFTKMTRANANQRNHLYLDSPGIYSSVGSFWRRNYYFNAKSRFQLWTSSKTWSMFLKWISQHQCKSQRGWLSFLSLRFEIPRLPATTALNPRWNHSFKCYQERLNSSSFWDW